MALPAALAIPSILSLIGRGATAAYPFLRGALGFTGRRTTAGNLQNIAAASVLTGTGAHYGIDNWTAQGREEYDKSRSTDSAGTAAPEKTIPEAQKFMAGMESSVKQAVTEDEEEDPFNYNQLFIASILKGMKQDPPSQSSGRVAGTYIPRPDLPKMSDYDSNKTYWNIG